MYKPFVKVYPKSLGTWVMLGVLEGKACWTTWAAPAKEKEIIEAAKEVRKNLLKDLDIVERWLKEAGADTT